jgi:hypothetical protein
MAVELCARALARRRCATGGPVVGGAARPATAWASALTSPYGAAAELLASVRALTSLAKPRKKDKTARNQKAPLITRS